MDPVQYSDPAIRQLLLRVNELNIQKQRIETSQAGIRGEFARAEQDLQIFVQHLPKNPFFKPSNMENIGRLLKRCIECRKQIHRETERCSTICTEICVLFLKAEKLAEKAWNGSASKESDLNAVRGSPLRKQGEPRKEKSLAHEEEKTAEGGEDAASSA